MTNKEKLLEGIAWVEKYGIDVQYQGTAKSVKNQTGCDMPYNGCAYVEAGLIDLYADHPERSTAQLLAVLVHEFGHIMDYRITGDGDDEAAAWKAGIAHFPKHLIPDCLPRIREKCLAVYKKYSA